MREDALCPGVLHRTDPHAHHLSMASGEHVHCDDQDPRERNDDCDHNACAWLDDGGGYQGID